MLIACIDLTTHPAITTARPLYVLKLEADLIETSLDYTGLYRE